MTLEDGIDIITGSQRGSYSRHSQNQRRVQDVQAVHLRPTKDCSRCGGPGHSYTGMIPARQGIRNAPDVRKWITSSGYVGARPAAKMGQKEVDEAAEAVGEDNPK